MTLRTAEGMKQDTGFIEGLVHRLEKMHYTPLATPSRKNLLKVFEILTSKEARLNYISVDGDMIEIQQTDIYQPERATRQVQVMIQQPIPEHIGMFLQTVMEPDRSKKNCVDVSTCLVEQVKTENGRSDLRLFNQLGDLMRTDSINEDRYETFFKTNDEDTITEKGPTDKWITDENHFDIALTRAYLLLVNRLFSVGEVQLPGQELKVVGLLQKNK